MNGCAEKEEVVSFGLQRWTTSQYATTDKQ